MMTALIKYSQNNFYKNKQESIQQLKFKSLD